MPLTLKIVSRQRHILGADSLRVFSVHGGSIGRAPDNDWVLPDPDRYISGHHASIDYRGGAYYLRDNSTNGIYVNRSDQPVGRGAPLRLYDGDELRMGDYVFEVSIVNISRDGVDDSGEAVVTRPARKATPDALDASSLSLKLLGEEAGELSDAARVAPERVSRAPLALEDDPFRLHGVEDDPFAATTRFPDDGLETELDIEVPPPPMPEQQAAPELRLAGTAGFGVDAPRKSQHKNSGERRDFTEAVRLMMECAGLDSTKLPRNEEDEIIAIAGRLIRATAEGMQSVLRARTLVNAQFRVAQTAMTTSGNNPLKFLPTTQDALEHMYYDRPEGYLGPVEAIEDGFSELRAHQTAMVKAMQAAFRDLLDRLEPDTLEERFGRMVKRGGWRAQPEKSQYWDMYREAFQSVAGFNDETFAAVVGAKFADAYQREMHHLETQRSTVRKIAELEPHGLTPEKES
jgi:type VI secretion system FHA domain protein